MTILAERVHYVGTVTWRDVCCVGGVGAWGRVCVCHLVCVCVVVHGGDGGKACAVRDVGCEVFVPVDLSCVVADLGQTIE